jgi:transposase-like protein
MGRNNGIVKYSEAFKLQVVSEVEGGMYSSAHEASVAYGIAGHTTVKRWLKEYGKPRPLEKVERVDQQNEANEVRVLNDRVRQLEAALADVVMDQALDQAFFGILCERTGTDAMEFKKKHVGTARTRPTRRYKVTEE